MIITDHLLLDNTLAGIVAAVQTYYPQLLIIMTAILAGLATLHLAMPATGSCGNCGRNPRSASVCKRYQYCTSTGLVGDARQVEDERPRGADADAAGSASQTTADLCSWRHHPDHALTAKSNWPLTSSSNQTCERWVVL